MRNVESAAQRYRTAGLPAHTHPAADGFQNGGWRLDERYIEILTVTDETQMAQSRYATGLKLLQPAIEAVRGGNGAITFAINVTDARQTADRLRGAGYDVRELEVMFDESGVSFIEIFLVEPSRPWMPFFITYNPPREKLLEQIDPGAFDRGSYDIQGLEIASPEPDRARAELAALLGIAPVDGVIELPGAEIRVVMGDHEHIAAVKLAGDAHAGFFIDGLQFH